MKKPLKITLIFIGIIFSLYFILNWTGIFKVYDYQSTSNFPTLKQNSNLILSNLVAPKNGDFICYFNEKNVLTKTAVNRVCGKENDTVEIRYGKLFINGRNFDKELDLTHFYVLSKTEYNQAKSELKEDIRFYTTNGNDKDSIMVFLPYSYALENNFDKRRTVASKFDQNTIVQKLFKKNWNLDNFGPLIIPKNKFFVLGDNRDTAQDSRFVGLIDKKDIVGTVINK
ncbi:signal peptidase I [Winogradskyella maritima]|uniref:Signal peptidase I n=1 Tax=Winogradskyella maritima TaxID=1517766 RepID=A0ABV8AI42_9FLAO|nr:signal peptidase I [Winogradskyella maritima]